ncbi:uncharacterized isomerase BH0283-like [Impatiens glandulifera]|uniref:uncharacterized isomerase BH0283-like n=1 Tax=Impatiens glandulifera TaxID=253017 RepID=UPI001FB0FE80|nr:uncharacterized isomerase BH0283-like [Impatiens glandulifera]
MGKTPVKYSVIDAFTESPFKGNPAAVCLLQEERDDEWLQSVATEFNISETCYLILIPSTNSDLTPRFRLRWFTPVAEVKLCGHATLASAHFLFTSGLVAEADKIEFLTLSGILTAKRLYEAEKTDSIRLKNGQSLINNFSIELDFPVVPLVEDDPAGEVTIRKAINVSSIVEIKKATGDDFLVVLPSGKDVSDFEPQFDEIQKCDGRGLIITGLAPTGSGFDFISRFFAPKLGINEDPVTGSVHCALAAYWSKKLGKCDFVAYQASPRGGIINLHLDEINQRVLLRGKAVSVMEGSILV